jgi:hypothetical protein
MTRKFSHASVLSLVLVCCAITASSVFSQIAPQTEILSKPEEKTFFESPMGVQIAWYASIAGVLLGLIPLLLYFQEKNRSKLLNGVLEQFELAKTIERAAKDATAQKRTADEALVKSKQELEELTRQLEKTIPAQARAAFFNAAIPEIDRQILYLQEQRKAMERGLAETGVPQNNSSRLKSILRAEINQTVIARRKLDEKQTILSIFTGLAAGSAAFVFLEPIQYLVRVALGVIILWAVYGLCQQWAIVYPENWLSTIVRKLGWKLFLIMFLILSVITILFISLAVWLDRQT